MQVLSHKWSYLCSHSAGGDGVGGTQFMQGGSRVYICLLPSVCSNSKFRVVWKNHSGSAVNLNDLILGCFLDSESCFLQFISLVNSSTSLRTENIKNFNFHVCLLIKYNNSFMNPSYNSTLNLRCNAIENESKSWRCRS